MARGLTHIHYICTILYITCKKPCLRLHKSKPTGESKLRRRKLINNRTSACIVVIQKYQLYAMNIFSSIRSLIARNKSTFNIKSLTVNSLFLKMFFAPITFSKKDEVNLKIAAKSYETL